jgi:predicted PilT family ATPase
VPTSKRPQIGDVQYLRIPNRILKGALIEEVVNDVIAEVVMSGAVADEVMKICRS